MAHPSSGIDMNDALGFGGKVWRLRRIGRGRERHVFSESVFLLQEPGQRNAAHATGRLPKKMAPRNRRNVVREGLRKGRHNHWTYKNSLEFSKTQQRLSKPFCFSSASARSSSSFLGDLARATCQACLICFLGSTPASLRSRAAQSEA